MILSKARRAPIANHPSTLIGHPLLPILKTRFVCIAAVHVKHFANKLCCLEGNVATVANTNMAKLLSKFPDHLSRP